MTVFKLMRKKNENFYPLFINRKMECKLGKWIDAECFPTKGFSIRKGWHCCFYPIAPHLKTELSNGEKRVWVFAEIDDWETYDRPESQGGTWILAQKIKIIGAV